MTILTWILSALLAFAMIGAGASKLRTPRAKLLEDPRMGWAHDFTNTQVKAIAGAEVLGGIGIILPWLLNIAPVLTPIAAVGLAVTMLGATIVHGRRGELKQTLPVNAVLLALAVAVAVLRFSQL